MNIGVARHVLLELNAHSTILELQLTICVWVSKSKTSVTVSVQCISIKMKGGRKPHQLGKTQANKHRQQTQHPNLNFNLGRRDAIISKSL
jgi:hypothetical protein